MPSHNVYVCDPVQEHCYDGVLARASVRSPRVWVAMVAEMAASVSWGVRIYRRNTPTIG